MLLLQIPPAHIQQLMLKFIAGGQKNYPSSTHRHPHE
jgi:hypothetical protein